MQPDVKLVVQGFVTNGDTIFAHRDGTRAYYVSAVINVTNSGEDAFLIFPGKHNGLTNFVTLTKHSSFTFRTMILPGRANEVFVSGSTCPKPRLPFSLLPKRSWAWLPGRVWRPEKVLTLTTGPFDLRAGS